MPISLGTSFKSPVVKLPPKNARPRRRRRYENRRKKCPYCLSDLSAMDPGKFEALGNVCPLCRHILLEPLLRVPLRLFTRPQQWDLLADELEYIWNWEYRDVSSYRYFMAEFRNDDYTDEKERLVLALVAKGEVLRFRKEFLESEGDLEDLIGNYLTTRKGGDGRLGLNLMGGRKWRNWAHVLSEGSPAKRELLRFQWEMLKATPWGAFGSPGCKDDIVGALEEELKGTSPDSGNEGTNRP